MRNVQVVPLARSTDILEAEYDAGIVASYIVCCDRDSRLCRLVVVAVDVVERADAVWARDLEGEARSD